MPVLISPKTTALHNGQTFQVEDRSSFLARIAVAKAAQPVTKPVPFVEPKDVTYSLAQYQTGFRNQGDRGTCWAFGGTAAVEAAYKRQLGLTLDLSEQYVAHLNKVQELAYNPMDPLRSHENNSTLWDDQGASDILNKLMRSAICEEQYAPYLFLNNNPAGDSRSTMSHIQSEVPSGGTITAANPNPSQATVDLFEFREDVIPSAARAQCKYKLTGVVDPGKYDSKTIEAIVGGGHEVVIDITLDYTADANGIWQYDPKVSGGGHVVLVIGYDRTKQYFLIKNSWANTDFTKVSYGFIDKCCNWAHYVTGVVDPKLGPDHRAFWMGTWNMDHDGWRGTLNFRRHTNYHDTTDNTPTRLGTYVRDNVAYDVNGHFEDNYQHCVLYIAPTSARVTPGQETGQRFDFYCFSFDVQHAAGRTTWDNIAFGAMLSRPALPAAVPKAFDPNEWVGNYAMNHDGWQGTLSVTSLAPLHVTYKDSNGAHAVTGSVNQHEMKLTIAFPGNNQPFDLLYHTREAGIFSGTTTWAGRTFGVFGIKTA